MVCLLRIRDVDAYIIAVAEDVIHGVGAQDLARQPPRRIDRHERVVTVDRHAQLKRDIRNQRADRAEPDNAECLAQKLRPRKSGFALLDELRNGRALTGYTAHPADAAQHVTRRHHERAQLQLLDGLRICAGAVEHDYAMLGAVRNGDVVVPRARAAYSQKLRIELAAVQLRAAQEQCLRTHLVRADVAAARGERLDSRGGYAVHGFYSKHCRDLSFDISIFRYPDRWVRISV